jgi:hypothetical protein
MKSKAAFSLLLIPAFFLLTLTPAAHSDVWNKKTIVTFGEPVELPGRVVLQPGTYVMKLFDSPANRHIVQVFNARENHVYATVHTVAKYREEPAGKTIITFYETPKDMPQFIRAWFYPGDTIGQEFVYSKERQLYIASLMNRTTTTTTTTEVAMNKEPAPALVETPAEPAAESTAQQTTTESMEERSSAGAVGSLESPAEEQQEATPAPAPTPAPAAVETPRESLPKTASPLPMIGGLGLLLIAAGGLLRKVNS